MAKDFFAGLGDDTLPQVPGDTEQVAETDTVDEGFAAPHLSTRQSLTSPATANATHSLPST